MTQELGMIAPKRCAECGGVMAFGKLDSRVYSFRSVDSPPTYHQVVRYDMPGNSFPLVVNVCTVCGHVSLYAAYPPPGER